MAEESEKIYCTDNSAMWASMLANRNSSAETAALMNQNSAWNNNPFVYLVWMMMMRYMNGNGWDGNNGAENFNSRQIAALQDSVNTNHNNDLALQAINGNTAAITQLAGSFNTSIDAVQMAVSGVKSAIEQVGGQVGFSSERVINSVLLGNKDLTQALQTCCCENKMLQMQNFAAQQLQNSQNQAQTISRIDQLANGVQQGFAQIGFNQQTNANAIIQGQQNQTQTILNALNNHWTESLRDKLFEASQTAQTATIINSLKTTSTTTA